MLTDVTLVEERSKIYGAFNAWSSMGFIIGPMIGGNYFIVFCYLIHELMASNLEEEDEI